MARVVFYPVGKPKETMQLEVEADNRIDAMNEWLAVLAFEQMNPENYYVVGVVGIPNKYQKMIEAEEARRRNE
jgi:hypothetical protein